MMIRNWFFIALVALVLIPTEVQAAEWQEAVTVYGAALEDDPQLLEDTEGILGTKKEDKITFVNSEDVAKYIGKDYDDAVLKSSIRIIQREDGYGLDITVDETMGKITQITEETYKNALLTSGITDAEVTIGAAQDVTGESALSGIYKAFEAQGQEIDTDRTRNSQDELEAISDISKENAQKEGFSQEQLNKAITDIKIEIINQGGNLTEADIRRIVEEQLNENGLDGIVTGDQINRLVNILIQIQNTNIFTDEEAERLKDSAQNLIDEIRSSDAFKQAADKAEEIGQDIQDSDAWSTFKRAVSDFFSSIISFFKTLFN
ncbi:DUF1002 domain-containing protein [Salinicoccus siamensis]